MGIAWTVGTASALFILFTVFLVPLGYLVARRVLSEESELSVLVSFGISSLFWGGVVGLLVVLPMSNAARGIALWVLTLGLAFAFARLRPWSQLKTKGVSTVCLTLFLYYLFSLVSASFPDGTPLHVTPETIRAISGEGLPLDNSIPYNFSRYVIERVDPNIVEIMPTWKMSDRGPLAGLLVAAILLMLGVKETAIWLGATPTNYFIYQALMSYLNILPALALWIIARRYSGSRSAMIALLICFTTSFFFVNVLYSWPKFFATYFLLAALLLLNEKRTFVLSAVILAGGTLAHNIGSLYFISCLCFVVGPRLIAALTWARFQNLLSFLAMYFVVLLPWKFFQWEVAPPSGRLVGLHLFCNSAVDLSQTSLQTAFADYLNNQTFSEFLATRVGNLLYPFKVHYLFSEGRGLFSNPIQFLSVYARVGFYQFVPALGILVFVLLLISLLSRRTRDTLQKERPFLIVGFGVLLLSALSFGCPTSTVNHVWAYSAFLASLLPVSSLLGRLGFSGIILAALIGITNGIVLLFRQFVVTDFSPLLHGSSFYLGLVTGGFLLMVLAIVFIASVNARERTVMLSIPLVVGLFAAFLVARRESPPMPFKGFVENDLNQDGAADLVTFGIAPSGGLFRAYTTSGADGLTSNITAERGTKLSLTIAEPSGVPVSGDFNGDGKLDLGRYQNGEWVIELSPYLPSRQLRASLGTDEDSVPIPGDFNCDGTTEFTVFHRSQALWESANESLPWGTPGSIPLSGDFNGDGCSDRVLLEFEAGKVNWRIRVSPSTVSPQPSEYTFRFGNPDDIFLIGDFDGDRKAESVVYRKRVSRWYIRFDETRIEKIKWDGSGGIPFTGDFDRDGISDLALYQDGSPPRWKITSSALLRQFHQRLPTAFHGEREFLWGESGHLPLPVQLRLAQGQSG